MGELRDDDADDFDGLHLALPQTFSNDVRRKIMFARIPLYFLPLLDGNPGAVFEGAGHCRHGNTEVPCNILHRYAGCINHSI